MTATSAAERLAESVWLKVIARGSMVVVGLLLTLGAPRVAAWYDYTNRSITEVEREQERMRGRLQSYAERIAALEVSRRADDRDTSEVKTQIAARLATIETTITTLQRDVDSLTRKLDQMLSPPTRAIPR